MSKSSALISTSYAGPINYFAVIWAFDSVVLEHFEHFQKQTYRNRCTVYGPNGVLNLIIPLKKNKSRTVISEVKIANEHAWQKLHWRTLCAAYRSSPYFEYYEQDLWYYYSNRFDLLMDFNQKLTKYFLEKLEIGIEFEANTEYEKSPVNSTDLREISSAKKRIPANITYPSYPQVFEEKSGFIPNLSIFDLLFNLGPESRGYIHNIKNQLL